MSLKKIAIVGLAILLVGAAINIIFNLRGNFERKSETVTIEESNFQHIQVEAGSVSVEIVPSKNDETTVSFNGEAKKSTKYKLKAEVRRDTLEIKLKERRWSFINFGFSKKSTLIVSVPDKKYGELQMELDNGKILVSDMRVNEVEVETDNGSIELKDVTSKEINASTDNGRISMDNVEGKLFADTDNGQINLITNNLDRVIHFETDNGAIEIHSSTKPTNATIDVKVDNGKVDIFGHSDKQTEFGNGENLIRLETDNGRIIVNEK